MSIYFSMVYRVVYSFGGMVYRVVYSFGGIVLSKVCRIAYCRTLPTPLRLRAVRGRGALSPRHL